MKLISLALAASFVLAGYAQAQTPVSPAPSESPAPPSSTSGAKISHDCKKEVINLCGHAHGDTMKECVKDNLDMNKFSASCTSELKAAAPPKPSS